MNSEQAIVIIGSGWAGLAAAVKLTHLGKKVILLESARQVGGRARGLQFENSLVDNGQHILIGAYINCLKLIKLVGLNTQATLKRLPLSLTVIDKSSHTLHIKAPALPAPFHLLYALLSAKGLSFKERLSAVRFGLYLQFKGFKLKNDISVEALLSITRQPEILVRQLWEPLCLSVMNTPVKEASANIFMLVFKDSFTHKRTDADLLIPATDLSSLFPDAAIDYIQNNGGEVKLQSRVTDIIIENNQVTAVRTKSEELLTSNVILATAPQHINKLIQPHSQLQPVLKMIETFEYEPIVTVYLQYPENVTLPQPMLGMSSTITQWIFDRGMLCHQAGLISVVISSRGAHMMMDDEQLIATIQNEISHLFKKADPVLKNAFIVREKKATFSCKVDINRFRPENKTLVRGLTLAGDFTDTLYPATLEGAVRSGLIAAKITANNLIP